jgi:DNA polymerase III alpha subunit
VTLQQALDSEPQLQALRREDAAVSQMMDIALKLEGLYRNASTHAAGEVIEVTLSAEDWARRDSWRWPHRRRGGAADAE